MGLAVWNMGMEMGLRGCGCEKVWLQDWMQLL